VIDSDSPEFKTLFATWLGALKVMDTKLHAHYMAVASLQNNSEFSSAAHFFKDAVLLSQKDSGLLAAMDNKYDLALRKWEQLAPQSDFLEALGSWLQAYRLETPELD
jgi:hypothetical protein